MWVLNGRGPKLEKLTQSEGGQFHDGNCYMVLLTYCDKEDRNKQKFLGFLFLFSFFLFLFFVSLS